MMKTSRWLVPALAIGALILQGCAETGTTRPDMAQTTAAPAQAAAAAAPAQAPASVASTIREKDGKVVVAANTKDNFEAVAAAVRQQMQPGGRYAFVDKSGRQKVESNFTDMQALFNQYGSVDKMTPPAQSQLLADQNAINAVLARYDSNRRICWQETPVGTHFPKTVCRTLGEIQNQHNNSKQYLEQTKQMQHQNNSFGQNPSKVTH